MVFMQEYCFIVFENHFYCSIAIVIPAFQNEYAISLLDQAMITVIILNRQISI